MEEDKEDILNYTVPDSEQVILNRNQEAEQNMMSNARETNEEIINKLYNGELTPEQEDIWINGDPKDIGTEEITEEITQDINTNDDNNKVVEIINKAIDKNKSKYEESIKEANLSTVIELLNSIAGLLLAAPVDYKNNVISSFADDIADMRDNGRRIFRDKEQVLTFLNGILSGSLHRQPQRVKESVKNDNLTRNIILNPKLKNRKPRPYTKKNNYVYKGNSLKTVI